MNIKKINDMAVLRGSALRQKNDKDFQECVSRLYDITARGYSLIEGDEGTTSLVDVFDTVEELYKLNKSYYDDFTDYVESVAPNLIWYPSAIIYLNNRNARLDDEGKLEESSTGRRLIFTLEYGEEEAEEEIKRNIQGMSYREIKKSCDNLDALITSVEAVVAGFNNWLDKNFPEIAGEVL